MSENEIPTFLYIAGFSECLHGVQGHELEDTCEGRMKRTLRYFGFFMEEGHAKQWVAENKEDVWKDCLAGEKCAVSPGMVYSTKEEIIKVCCINGMPESEDYEIEGA